MGREGDGKHDRFIIYKSISPPLAVPLLETLIQRIVC